jgi:hypothetical protein
MLKVRVDKAVCVRVFVYKRTNVQRYVQAFKFLGSVIGNRLSPNLQTSKQRNLERKEKKQRHLVHNRSVHAAQQQQGESK